MGKHRGFHAGGGRHAKVEANTFDFAHLYPFGRNKAAEVMADLIIKAHNSKSASVTPEALAAQIIQAGRKARGER